MTNEEELRLEILRLCGGDVDRAQHGYEWVTGGDTNPADALKAAEDRIGKLEEALVWCSAASDFQEGGFARVGWLSMCKPLLDSMSNTSAQKRFQFDALEAAVSSGRDPRVDSTGFPNWRAKPPQGDAGTTTDRVGEPSSEQSIQDQSPQPSSKGEEGLGLPAHELTDTQLPESIEHRDEPDEFIAWSCGENDDFVCPVPLGTVIQILRRDQTKRARKIDAEFAKETYWYADGVEGDIIAYRVVAEPGVYLDWETPDGSEGEVFPEGVTKYTEVSVIQRDGGWFTSFGDGFCWDSDIVAYRIVSASSGDSGNPEAEPARDFVRIETQESQAPPYSQKHEEPVS